MFPRLIFYTSRGMIVHRFNCPERSDFHNAGFQPVEYTATYFCLKGKNNYIFSANFFFTCSQATYLFDFKEAKARISPNARLNKAAKST
jgi:hypothetical protein